MFLYVYYVLVGLFMFVVEYKLKDFPLQHFNIAMQCLHCYFNVTCNVNCGWSYCFIMYDINAWFL